MKILSTLCLLVTFNYANIYYAKVEPIKSYNVKSAVSGSVVYINNDIKSTYIKDKAQIVVKIDDKVNQTDLKESRNKLQNLKKIYKLEQNTLKSYSKISSKSRFDKDNQQIKILNIASNISDMKIKIKTLEDIVNKKTLKAQDIYIYDINVEVGDYVNPGTLLYKSMDTSSAKLTIFIPIDLAKDIKTKTIFIDNKKTNYKIDKLNTIADAKHISSFKCEIIIPKPIIFSKLLKVEFR